MSICPTLLPQCLAVSPQFPLHLVPSDDARVNPFVQRNDLRLSRQRLQLFLKTKNTIAPEKTSVDKHIKWKGRTVYDKRKLIFSQTHSDSATDHVHQKNIRNENDKNIKNLFMIERINSPFSTIRQCRYGQPLVELRRAVFSFPLW